MHLLLPRVCLFCREDIPFPLSGPLCGPCLRALRPSQGPSCARCSAPWEGPETCCPECRSRLFAVDLLRAAFPYEGPLPALVHAFKYSGRLSVGRVLADWMASLWPSYPELALADALVPVPLHPARLRSRGFDQARMLAQAVSAAAHIPVLEALRRVEDTPAQARLRRGERLGRLRAAFKAHSGLRGLKVVLIDDVCTSGGTLEGCGLALREAGATDVRAYVLAKA